MKGLTLIETLVYMTLLSVLMLASLALATQITATDTRDRDVVQESEEWLFALRKIEWATARATTREVSPQELRLASLDSSIDPLVFRIAPDSITLSIGGDAHVPILMLAPEDAVRFEETDNGFIVIGETGALTTERTYHLP